MKSFKGFLSAALVAMAILIAACAGGGGDAGTPSNPAAAKPVVAMGRITGFGSVFVNGVEFETHSAVVTMDGRNATEAELRVGHVVRIRGSIDADGQHGDADSVDFEDVVQGPVQSVDAAGSQLVVLGQTVRVDAMTFFDDDIQPASLDGVHVGDILEVSGFRGADGVVLATRLDLQDATDEFELHGAVSDHDAATTHFKIGDLTIDYSAAQLDDLPGGVITDGLVVEVQGVEIDANGVFLATRVEATESDMQGEDDDEASLEGMITRFVSATDFDVNGQAVTTTAATRYEHGTAADLALNVAVEVEGVTNNGVLEARKIEFREGEHEANLRVSAPVTAVDAAAGTFTVLGILVQTSASTSFEDDTDAHVRPFNVEALHVGDFVEVRGVAGTVANSIAATRVERDEAEDRVEVRGPAANVAAPDLTILGVTVHTDASTEFEGDGENDTPISADDFFAQAEGRIVNARGVLQGAVLGADEVEFEDSGHGGED